MEHYTWYQYTVALVLCTSNLGHAFHPPPLYYHHYDNMTAELMDVQRKYPDLTNLYSIGTSVQGKELWVLEVTGEKEGLGLPYVKLVGNIHGNEPLGKELLIHLIKYLLAQYVEGDKEIVNILRNTKLHIMPSMNPDGFELSSEGTCRLGPGRSNANGVDLNRNFPEDDVSSRRKEEPEVTAVREWLKTRPFILSASLHGGALLANYPFDKYRHHAGRRFTRELGEAAETDDDDIFRHLALIYSESHPDMYRGFSCKPPYLATFNKGITNGAAWYPVSGGMQDYNYLWHGCMELTLEIGCCKYPPVEKLPIAWRDNLKPMLKLIGEGQRGVKGLVLDGKNLQGISGAKVRVGGRNMTSVTSHRGEYWRILLPGTYFLEVSASGYRESKVRVEVPRSQFVGKLVPVWVNITLSPLEEVTDSFPATSETFDFTSPEDGQTPTFDPSPILLMDYYRGNESDDMESSSYYHRSQMVLILLAIIIYQFLR